MNDMPISTTIWFRPKDTSGALSVKIEALNPYYLKSLARNVWDNLNKNFEMVTSRP